MWAEVGVGMRKKLVPILALYALAAILSLGGAIGASAFTPEWASEARNRAYRDLNGFPGTPPFSWKNWVGECDSRWASTLDVDRDGEGLPCIYQYGFPFRCVFSRAERLHFEDPRWPVRNFVATHVWTVVSVNRQSWDTPQNQEGAIVFAIGILPLGLFANALTIGTTLLLVIVAIRAVVAHRRRRKGRCTKCGYQLVGLASTVPCPECGQNAPRSVAT